MEIIVDFPPNFTELSKTFDLSKRQPVFTHGETLYNPFDIDISDDLMAHENVHEYQQSGMGSEEWWSLYLESPEFRYDQEAAAYGQQYRFFCIDIKDRNQRFRILHQLALALSSELYGHCCTYAEAVQKIRTDSDVEAERYA